MKLEITDHELNIVLAALELTETRYNPKYNGNIRYTFAFPELQHQVNYANEFRQISDKIREQIK